MAQNHGVFDDELSDRAVNPVVDVAAADAGPFYVYDDGVRIGEGWGGTWFVGYEAWFLEDEGEVLVVAVSVLVWLATSFERTELQGVLYASRSLGSALLILRSD